MAAAQAGGGVASLLFQGGAIDADFSGLIRSQYLAQQALLSAFRSQIMVPSSSAAIFERFLGARGVDARTATLHAITEAMLRFYETVPALGLAAEDSDMLLFQFGVYDWGSGGNFEFDITRQFIVYGEVDDHAISQLHCTFLYEPVAELRTVGRGNRWCHSQQDLSAFRTFILSSEAYMKALPLPPKLRRIQWDRV